MNEFVLKAAVNAITQEKRRQDALMTMKQRLDNQLKAARLNVCECLTVTRSKRKHRALCKLVEAIDATNELLRSDLK